MSIFRKLAGLVGVASTALAVGELHNRNEEYKTQLMYNTCNKTWEDLNKLNPNKYHKKVVLCGIRDSQPINLKTALDFKHGIQTAVKKYNCNEPVDLDEPVDLVIFIETCGGELGSCKMICDTMSIFKEKYKGNVFTVVNSHAFSGGSIIALSSDYIMMNDYAVLSKIDPQIFGIASKYLQISDETSNPSIIDRIANGIQLDGMGTAEEIFNKHIQPRYDIPTYKNIISDFVMSNKLHEHTFTKLECINMGINIECVPDNFNI